MDPDLDPRGPKSCGSGSPTLVHTYLTFCTVRTTPHNTIPVRVKLGLYWGEGYFLLDFVISPFRYLFIVKRGGPGP